MALFKTFRGQRTDLDNVAKVDGHAYFCMDDGTFWIDYKDNEEVKRKQINKEDWTKDIEAAVAALKSEIEEELVNKTDYLGAVSSIEELSTTAGNGDYHRVAQEFQFGNEVAHVGDLLIALINLPAQTPEYWDLIHTGATVQVDWNQNDETAQDYIKNRPFYENETIAYEWDGSTDGREVTGFPEENDLHVAYKISDTILSIEEISAMTVYNNKGEVVDLLWEDSGTGFYIGGMTIDNKNAIYKYPMIWCMSSLDGVPEGYFPSTGVYFTVLNDTYISRIVQDNSYVSPFMERLLQPDWNESDPSKKGYIKNRPFSDEVVAEIPSVTYTFDGNLEGREAILIEEAEDLKVYLVKISDDILSYEQLIGGNITAVDPVSLEVLESITLTEDNLSDLTYGIDICGWSYVVSDPQEFSNISGWTVQNKGLYFVCVPHERGIYVSQLTTPSITNIIQPIKKLDSKFLPDGLITEAGGNINGDLTIQGNLTVSGTNTAITIQTLEVKDNVIVANANGVELIDKAGFAIKTNGNKAYGIMYDPNEDGVKIGLGSIDSSGKFEYIENEDQLLATRTNSIADGNLVYWNDTEKTFKDAHVALKEERSIIHSETVVDSDTVNFEYKKYWDGFLGDYDEIADAILYYHDPAVVMKIEIEEIETDNFTYWIGTAFDDPSHPSGMILSFAKAGIITDGKGGREYNVPSRGTYIKDCHGFSVTGINIEKLDGKFLSDNISITTTENDGYYTWVSRSIDNNGIMFQDFTRPDSVSAGSSKPQKAVSDYTSVDISPSKIEISTGESGQQQSATILPDKISHWNYSFVDGLETTVNLTFPTKSGVIATQEQVKEVNDYVQEQVKEVNDYVDGTFEVLSSHISMTEAKLIETEIRGFPQMPGWKISKYALNHNFKTYNNENFYHEGFANFIEYENLADSTKHMIKADIHITSEETITEPSDIGIKIITTTTVGNKWESTPLYVNNVFPEGFLDNTKYTNITVDKYQWITDITQDAVGRFNSNGSIGPVVYADRSNGFVPLVWGNGLELDTYNDGQPLIIGGKEIEVTYYDYYGVVNNKKS